MLAPALTYGSKTILWKEERCRIRVIQIDNLRSFLGIRRMDRVLNGQIRELCSIVMKGVDKRIDDCSLMVWSFGEDGEGQDH